MRRYAVMSGVVVAALILAPSISIAAEPMDSGKAFTKLTRGFINFVTGWVEIPKRVQETSRESGALAGFTWGLLRGFGHGFIRTAGGAYEFFTFPFPAPPNYEPIIEPEYVFSEASSTTASHIH